MSNYHKYYANNGIVAYAPEGKFSDLLFICGSADPTAEPESFKTLKELFARWNGPKVQKRRRRAKVVRSRSLYFCQQFELDNLKVVLDEFCAVPGVSKWWGKLVYWRNDVFKGGTPATLFPVGVSAPIKTGLIKIVLEGQTPASLDDFDISLDGSTLLLGFGTGTKCRIRRGDGTVLGVSNTQSLSLSLAPSTGFVAGAVGASVPWPKDRHGEHPLRMAGFVFQARPDKLPPPGERRRCPSWRAQLADEVDQASGQSCVVALDPRDDPIYAQWLGGGLNSRLEFGETLLHSSFFGSKAQRVHLKAMQGAVARLGFVFDMMKTDESVESAGDVIFHPEGTFQIVSPSTGRARRREAALAIGRLDLIAGAAATEFFDLDGIDRIEFLKAHPAFFKEGEDRIPLEDKESRVITSFLRFSAAARGNPVVHYHTQPADAPLFESVEKDHLTRRRAFYGTIPEVRTGAVPVGMPLFPWAGYKGGSEDPLTVKMRRFEVTHLALWRRQNVRRPTAKQASRKDRAVAPQGLLAEVTPEGYVKLFFGNSDAANQLQAEFSITIAGPDSELFREVQQTLAGSQLFLVFDRPQQGSLDVIKPANEIHIRDFSFSVSLGANAKHRATAIPEHSVLIVKYFKKKSLAELIKDPSTWGCRRSLAKAGDALGIESLAHLGGDSNNPMPENLKHIWNDQDWQGVLALNLPILAMPDIVEALRPGMVEANLKAHHFGLNFLPVRKEDIDPGIGLPKDPFRLGSAFGLIDYTKPSGDPVPPEPSDEEPGLTKDSRGRQYSLVVDSLAVGFQNSQISSFEAKVRVNFSHLFWDKSSIGPVNQKLRRRRRKLAVGADGLELVGNYERRVKEDGGTEDVFSLRTEIQYEVDFEVSSFLKSLTLRRAQLSITSSQRDPGTKLLNSLTAFIGIDGDLELRDEKMPIPLFKVKALHLSNFGFQFVFTPHPTGMEKRFTFGLKADGIAADIEFDPPSGLSSVLGLLPVKPKGMTVALGKLLDFKNLGFQPITFDSNGGIGSFFHFGIVLELDLGFLGSLAGDLRGLRLPMILGWRGGAVKGLAFGIQFPTFEGKIDIGIQQFIRLRADQLNLVRCPKNGVEVKALAIQAVNAKVVMFGREWPDAETSIAIFIPVHPSRKASWALGVKPSGGGWLKYVGGGHRIALPGNPIDTKSVVAQYRDNLGDASKVCSLIDAEIAKPDADGWTVVAEFSAGVNAWLAVSDAQKMYGLALELPALGEVDVLYRRVDEKLGIFSAEYTLPEAIRTIQVGAATLRLPTFRVEVHTDGGFLFDLGFPWKNDFSRSCQVEIAIFLGAGGFYYGRTSAAASDLLGFDGGYGYGKPNSSELQRFKSLRIGFAARVGIGRSFSIGILSAEASLTIFGGLEGAAGYPDGGGSLLSPTIYAMKGYVGLMLDIRAEVSFAIIQARARLLAYALVGLEIRRVIGQQDNTHYFLSLPTVLYAEIGLTVEVDVEISIGCVDISIHLSFSATWRLEETLGSLSREPIKSRSKQLRLSSRRDPLVSFVWNTNYRYWANLRDLNLFVTVLPCKASAADVGESGDGYRTCAIGQMLLPVRSAANGFSDLAQFLAGWVLRPNTVNGIAETESIFLGEVSELRRKIKDSGDAFWTGFQPALETVVGKQFTPILNNVSKANADDPFASIPLWPHTTFRYVPKEVHARAIVGQVDFVTEAGVPLRGDDAGFANYASCAILGLLSEMEQLIVENGKPPKPAGEPTRNDPEKSLTWGEIWNQIMAPLKIARKP